MAIEQLPQQVASTAKQTAQELKNQVGQIQENRSALARTVAIGSLIAGMILLVRGNRKAGIAVSAAGAAAALFEDPKEAKELWANIPRYLESGRRVIARFESFVEELSAQSAQIRKFLENMQR